MKSFKSRLVSFATCFLAASSAFAANNAGPGGGGGSDEGPNDGSSGGSGGNTEESIRRVPVEYPTIQAAIDAANQGDQILVSPLGAYRGSGDSVIDTKGKALWIKALADEFSGPVTIDGEGVRRCVVCDSGEGSNTIIQGFRIVNGAEQGVRIYQSSPTFKNCFFKDNGTNGSYGGGVNCNGNSSPTFTDCTFSGNTATFGGGMLIQNSSPMLVNCTFVGNAAAEGGGIDGWGQSGSSYSPILINCTFAENTAKFAGGGAFLFGLNTSLTDCVFENNMAGANNYDNAWGGGGIFQHSGTLSLERCIFTSNWVADDGDHDDYGGGMAIFHTPSFECYTTLIECQFESNSATLGGGIHVEITPGLYSHSTKPVLNDTVVCGNSPDQINGNWIDNGGNTVSDECGSDLPEDVNTDGAVDGADLAVVLGAWGSENSAADIDQDGIVNGADLALLLGAWN